MRHLIAILVVLSAGILTGCGNADAKTEPPKPPSPFAKIAGSWWGQNYEAKIAENGTFEIHAGGHVVKGMVKLETNKVSFLAEEFDGQPPKTAAEKKPVAMTLSEDGKTLTPKQGPVLQRK